MLRKGQKSLNLHSKNLSLPLKNQITKLKKTEENAK